MGINFPSFPADGQVLSVSPGVSFVASGGRWRPAPLKTALPKNYIVNPAMQVSQQNGDTASAASSTVSYYPADQWLTRFQNITGYSGYAARASIHPAGLQSIYIHTTTPLANFPANSSGLISQYIEGNRVADLNWGTANAVPIVVRLSAMSTAVTGTFSFRIGNNTSPSRSYIQQFDIPTANVWTDVAAAVPGDTTGTWPTDTGIGMTFDFVGGGTAVLAGVAGWQAGDKTWINNGQVKSISAVGDIHFTAVGIYADPYLTGLPPPFVVPSPFDELRRCQRYWYKGWGARGVMSTTTQFNRADVAHPVPMRGTPTLALAGAPKAYDGTTSVVMTTMGANNSNSYVLEMTATVPALVAARPASHILVTDADYIAVNARM